MDFPFANFPSAVVVFPSVIVALGLFPSLAFPSLDWLWVDSSVSVLVSVSWAAAEEVWSVSISCMSSSIAGGTRASGQPIVLRAHRQVQSPKGRGGGEKGGRETGGV